MNETLPHNMDAQDAQTVAQYSEYMEPRLLPGEAVCFLSRWSLAKGLFPIVLGMFFFGWATLSSYRQYYIFETIQAACGGSRMRDCGKFYSASTWLVPLGGVLTAVVFVFFIFSLFGWHRQLYAITNQRVLVCRLGFPQGFEAFEIKEVTHRLGWTGLRIEKGGKKMFFFLDSWKAKVAQACLADAIARLTL